MRESIKRKDLERGDVRMKVLQINSFYGKLSTGRIAADLVNVMNQENIEAYVATLDTTVKSPRVYSMSDSFLYNKSNILMTRLFGRHGFYNRHSTKKLLRYIDSVSPDIIHLHNIHGHYINIKLLFDYINKHHIPVVWTLHDCWTFTGHCPHFDLIGCDKWKTGCHHCPQRRGYPDSWFFDRSKENYRDKKELFTSVERMHIVTPSHWLAELARQSFLGKYPVTVIHNGIDTAAFRPTHSDLRKTLGLEGKFVIMGMVRNFGGTKGGEYFLKLSEKLRDDEHIILLALGEDKDNLPPNITPIPATDSTRRLAEIYSTADVFVNPTLQDTFPTVNIEALACGVPVVTFKTGGSPESVTDKCGIVVEKGDVEGLYEAIEKIRKEPFDRDECRSRGLLFDRDQRLSEYTEIYRSF